MTNKTALITGASRGLGEVVATFLARAGYELVLTARRADDLEAVADRLREHTAVAALPGDVADEDHRRALHAAIHEIGGLDILVNNASELGPSPMPALADFPLDELEHVLRVNVVAPIGLVQELIWHLRRRGGLVVNISSDAAVGAYEGWGGYGASKAALDLVSRTFAQELRADGISVVAVDPGDMRTDMHQAAFPGEDISDRLLPDVTVPFWAWLFGADRETINGGRFQAQGERWEIAS
ncbi:MAG TPA: SDR family oxidoreductase [Actinomycetota bacterium]|jgi:NAD(P)-dependent dehydrogenase (short-subunit alcohol dehydrogenase family)|nr:SDR family oxidoreductase [Actinomycetota bacterium]